MCHTTLPTSGFTILELLVVLTISGILLAFAAPSLSEILRQNRAANYSNDFIADIQLARVEAIKRGVSVSMCPSATEAMDACGSNLNWDNGWIIFVDANSDGALDAPNDRIKVHNNLNRSMSVISTSSAVTFSTEGFVAQGQGGFTVKSTECVGEHARLVSLSAVGRASTTVATCS